MRIFHALLRLPFQKSVHVVPIALTWCYLAHRLLYLLYLLPNLDLALLTCGAELRSSMLFHFVRGEHWGRHAHERYLGCIYVYIARILNGALIEHVICIGRRFLSFEHPS